MGLHIFNHTQAQAKQKRIRADKPKGKFPFLCIACQWEIRKRIHVNDPDNIVSSIRFGLTFVFFINLP